MTDFRQRIRDMQRRKRIGTYALAKRAGLRTTATLYNYLNGKSDMTAGNLEKVLDTLETIPNGKDNSHPDKTDTPSGR